MGRLAFIVLEQESINSAGLDILQPLLKTQGFSVAYSSDILTVPDKTDYLFVEVGSHNNWDLVQAQLSKIKTDADIVLFNVDSETDLANRALLGGIRGVFYMTDNADVLVKGMRMLQGNQLWYSRDVMSNALNRLLQFNKEAIIKLNEMPVEKVKLTKREKAIISLMSKGCKNKEIAENLNISPHTVKTHLYSAFRKTNCRNRIELLSWAQNNIPEELR